MKKRTFYYISFEAYDEEMSDLIKISKKEYEAQLKFLRNQLKLINRNSLNSEEPFKEIQKKHSTLNNRRIETISKFQFIYSCTYLIKTEYEIYK